MTVLSYHNDPAIKKKIVDAMIADKASERLIQGKYATGEGSNFKGCFIGCVTRTNSGEKTAEVLGESFMLVRLRESIFEGLPFIDAQEFAVNCLEATPVGKDLSLVPWQFLDRTLRRAFSKIDNANPVHLGCGGALDIISKKALGEVVTAQAAADAAADAASTAADAAAYSVYALYAADAASTAADAAKAADDAVYAAKAADDAVYAADALYAAVYPADAAYVDERKDQAKDLLELLAAA
jgi:hypothetical protein